MPLPTFVARPRLGCSSPSAPGGSVDERMFAPMSASSTHETAALIALLRTGDRPWHHYSDLVEGAGSAVAVLRGDYVDPDELPTLFDARGQSSEPDLSAAIEEIERWRAEGMTILTVLDDAYPNNLRTVHNRPPLLFVRGELKSEDDRSIAIVGTRRASEGGLRAAREIAGEIAAAGYTVLSGLAAGIDTAAHGGTLERGGRTVAVIGTGLRRSYPTSNGPLQRRLGQEMAVVSQFWPDAPPTKHSFPMRNIVMSGFALATLVVEASNTSGARMQARFALEHGRPVFLLRSLLEHDWARRYAGRPGTHVVDSAAQVLERLERLISVDALST